MTGRRSTRRRSAAADAGRRRFLAGGVALAGAMLAGLGRPGRAAPSGGITVTDILGRSVTVAGPVERVILGEGRQIAFVAALDREAPFRRVVGWRDDLIKSDPATFDAYRARFPDIASLPRFGTVSTGGFDVERAIALAPDLVVFNVEARGSIDESRVVDKLASVGIPCVFIDFRDRPFEHTEPSMRILGRLFGREDVAEAMIAFRRAEIARVTERLAAHPDLVRPLVEIDRIPGTTDDCCLSFGAENFGRVVEIAGGRNLGSALIPGTFGILNPEAIVAADPAVVIATGGNWQAIAPGGGWVGLGPGADLAEARRRLAALMRRPAFVETSAVRTGRVHAIWHQFYNTPYQFVAVQVIARWLHPELFADLDPDATFRTLHERFLPVAYRPGYWVDLVERAP
ncbi:ABC transporter substrate-binding protein [Methyloraptor flagellatus]|jgi:iron complex transport system substrate-binding protein|uniref:ABC transporter substrate-binding protein n=2 Tax=Methyloraptor flagellatus TaxID=3162530 RepID=A0AAU7XCP2_9HYPH